MKKIVRSYLIFTIIISIFMVNTSVFAVQGPAAISYISHCSDIGWQAWKSNGNIAGTTGQSRQMEAIRIKLSGSVQGGIQYRAHCSDIGWQGWKSNGNIAGTTGQGRQMEAIQIKLTGFAQNAYDVVYRVHVADRGWLSWVKNGATAGTTGQNRRIEAIQIKLQAKNLPYISYKTLKNAKLRNTTASYSRMYFMIDESGTKYLVSVSYDKNGNIVSYAPWNMPIDM